MSWIDKVAFMAAQRHTGMSFVVTANIDNIQFKAPMRVGDHVILTGKVVYAGKTSMEIAVQVEKESAINSGRSQAGAAWLTFVALDKDSCPTQIPRLVPESAEDLRLFEQAKMRVAVRHRLRAWVARTSAKTEEIS